MSFLPNNSEDEMAQGHVGILPEIYLWMFSGLMMTSLVAYFISSFSFLTDLFIYKVPVWIFSIILQVLFAIVVGCDVDIKGLRTINAGAKVLYFSYTALNCFTFSIIFYSLGLTFIIPFWVLSAGMYAGLYLHGFLTKQDLSPWGSFWRANLWGAGLLIVFSLFLNSNIIDMLIFCVAVLVFAGLTAYDVHKINSFNAHGYVAGEKNSHNNAVSAALMLQLDFINSFVLLMRLLDMHSSLFWFGSFNCRPWYYSKD